MVYFFQWSICSNFRIEYRFWSNVILYFCTHSWYFMIFGDIFKTLRNEYFEFFERFEIFDGPSLYFIFEISIFFLIFLTFANCIIRMSDEDIPFRFKNPINVNTDTDSRKKWSILISRSVKKSIFSQKLQKN